MTTQAKAKEDAADILAKNVVDCQYDDIPVDVLENTKRGILDSLGVIIAGSSFHGIKPPLELAREWGGREESTILVFGDKVPAVHAVFVNGIMGEAWDFTDAYSIGITHIAVPTTSAAFAMAERKDEPVTGKDLLTAVVLGQDVGLRMFRYMEMTAGFSLNGLHSCYGVTAVAGRMLGLNEDQLGNGFGIAYNQMSGSAQSYLEKADTKEMIAGGEPARIGVVSGLLAQRGFTGPRNSIEGPSGFCKQYCRGRCNLERLTANLGKEFEGINIGFKPYPCGY
jgi:2-methylcitrate dehydratase PrpD